MESGVTMKKVLPVLCALFLTLSGLGSIAADDAPRFVAASGAKQIFLQYDKVAVSSESGLITASAASKTSVIAQGAMNGVYYVGRYVVGFGKTAEKNEETWFSYNVDNGQIKHTIIPTKSAPFWGDAKGLYYADLASKPNLFRYDPASGKTTKLLSSITGNPCGYVGGRVICLDTAKSRILAYDAKKNMTVLFSDGGSILDVRIVGGRIFVSRNDGFFRLDNGRPIKLYDNYAPIVGVAEPYFINVLSEDSKSTLQGTLSLHLNDAKNMTRAMITNDAGLSASSILNAPGISSNGSMLAFGSKAFALPRPADMRPYQ